MGKGSNAIRVLHVDDEPGFADLTTTFLEREDDRFDTETVTSVKQGLDRLSGRTYDCLVSDHDMPGQSGIEFLETVRDEYPNLPFILFTGKGSEEVASDAISAGVTDYLQKKPPDPTSTLSLPTGSKTLSSGGRPNGSAVVNSRRSKRPKKVSVSLIKTGTTFMLTSGSLISTATIPRS